VETQSVVNPDRVSEGNCLLRLALFSAANNQRRAEEMPQSFVGLRQRPWGEKTYHLPKGSSQGSNAIRLAPSRVWGGNHPTVFSLQKWTGESCRFHHQGCGWITGLDWSVDNTGFWKEGDCSV